MKKDLLIIILVLLLAACVGVGSFYIFKSLDDKPENETGNENTPVTDQNPNQETGIVDITNSSLATELEKKLITSDNRSGMYFLDKVSITDTTNSNLLSFNFKEYYLDNKLHADFGSNETITISKNDFNNYMNKKYNTNSTYNVNIDKENGIKSLNDNVPVYVRSEDSNYVYYGKNTGGAIEKVLNKLVKAEQEKDYIYLYDKAVYCESDAGYLGCFSTVYNCNYSGCSDVPKSIFECGYNGEDGSMKCTDNKKADTIENLSLKVLNDYEDKLHTFKHTFKKGTDNNYYWVSSEISR